MFDRLQEPNFSLSPNTGHPAIIESNSVEIPITSFFVPITIEFFRVNETSVDK